MAYNIEYANKDYKQLLTNAIWDGFTVLRFERYTDGSYEKSVFRTDRTFISNGKLYESVLSFGGQSISSVFPLNMDKDNMNCGVYFEIENNL